jgi:hypothetical protein
LEETKSIPGAKISICERQIIRFSDIDSEQKLDFSGPIFKTSFLGFNKSGICWMNKCENNNYMLENITKGIIKLDLNLNKWDLKSFLTAKQFGYQGEKNERYR